MKYTLETGRKYTLETGMKYTMETGMKCTLESGKGSIPQTLKEEVYLGSGKRQHTLETSRGSIPWKQEGCIVYSVKWKDTLESGRNPGK